MPFGKTFGSIEMCKHEKSNNGTILPQMHTLLMLCEIIFDCLFSRQNHPVLVNTSQHVSQQYVPISSLSFQELTILFYFTMFS